MLSKISVIIPVYNVEKYLGKCLDSVICQTFSDIEIICINDGSQDNSLEVLNSYAKKDSRIVVINKKNEGVSVARNMGLDMAQGDYIMFLDGDDSLVPDACELAYAEITKNNADICVFSHLEQDEENLVPSSKNKQIKKYANNPDFSGFQVFIWDKIYKKSFFDKNNLRFPIGVKTSEDTIFCWSCMFNNPKYAFLDKALYIYRINRPGSATSDFTKCIKNDLAALKTIHNMPLFQSQPVDVQLKLVEKFCKGAVYYWDNFYKLKQRKVLLKDIKELVKFIGKNYPKNELKSLKKYQTLKHIYFYTLLTSSFSIINMKNRKVITILGLRIKCKRKKH